MATQNIDFDFTADGYSSDDGVSWDGVFAGHVNGSGDFGGGTMKILYRIKDTDTWQELDSDNLVWTDDFSRVFYAPNCYLRIQLTGSTDPDCYVRVRIIPALTSR